MILQPYPSDADHYHFEECGMWTGVPFECYCLWPAVDKTALWKLYQTTPAHYRWAMDHPEPEECERECLLVGHAAHAFTLDDEGSRNLYVVRPRTYVADRGKDKGQEKPWNANAIVCKDWLKFIRADGKIVLTQAQWDIAAQVKDAAWKHSASRELLEGAEVEVSMLWNNPQTGLRMKGRIDVLHGGVLADLKTTQCAAPGRFGAAAYKFGYHVQAAIYIDGARVLSGLGFERFIFIAVETHPPWAVRCCELDAGEDLDFARAQYHGVLQQIAFCEREGKWPAYAEGISTLVLPGYAGHELQG